MIRNDALMLNPSNVMMVGERISKIQKLRTKHDLLIQPNHITAAILPLSLGASFSK